MNDNNHHTLDTAFAENDRPLIEADADGMLAVLLLRRIAYTVLALFRAASRTDEGRATRWRALLAWVRDALVAATPSNSRSCARARSPPPRSRNAGLPTRSTTSQGCEVSGGRERRRRAVAAACVDVQATSQSGAPDGGA